MNLKKALILLLTTLALAAQADTYSLTSNAIVTRGIGIAPSGTTLGIQYLTTYSGNPLGNSDVRSILERTTLSGDYGTAQLIHRHVQVEFRHTTGTVNLAHGEVGYFQLGKSGSVTGNVNSARGYDFHIANESANGHIATGIHYQAGDTDFEDGAGTIGTNIGFRAGNLGHASRVVGVAIGFDSANMTGGAPLTASYRSLMTAGANKWALFSSGDASSAHAGRVRVGSTVPPEAMLDVSGDVAATSFTLPGGLGIYSGVGAPTFPAAKGSLYLRSDDAGQHYRNTDGGTGWVEM